jgi:hypothetical protein
VRWRAWVLALGAVVAAALPVPAGAQAPPPSLTLSRTSGPVGTTFTATMNNVSCVQYQVTWDQPARTFAGNAKTRTATVTVPSGSNIGFHTVTGVCVLDSGSQVTATADFRVTYPTTVAVSPSCGPPGARNRVTVSGQGFEVTVFIFFDDQNVGSADPQPPAGSFSTVVTFPARGPGTYVVLAQDDLNNEARTTFVVPCPTTTAPTTAPTTTTRPPTTTTPPTTAPPTTAPPSTGTTLPPFVPPPLPAPVLRLEPVLGPPGFAPVAIGTGFAPFSQVQLRWAPGLGGTTAVTDATGSFRVSVLVLRKDTLGPRQLNAGGPAGTASAPYLVVPPSMQPPRFTFRR